MSTPEPVLESEQGSFEVARYAEQLVLAESAAAYDLQSNRRVSVSVAVILSPLFVSIAYLACCHQTDNDIPDSLLKEVAEHLCKCCSMQGKRSMVGPIVTRLWCMRSSAMVSALRDALRRRAEPLRK